MLLLLKRGKCFRVNVCKVATVTEPRLKVFILGILKPLHRVGPFSVCVESVGWYPGEVPSPAHRCYRAYQKGVWAEALPAGSAFRAWGIPKCAAVTAPPPKWPLPSAAASDGRHLPTLWWLSFVRWCIKDRVPFRTVYSSWGKGRSWK